MQLQSYVVWPLALLLTLALGIQLGAQSVEQQRQQALERLSMVEDALLALSSRDAPDLQALESRHNVAIALAKAEEYGLSAAELDALRLDGAIELLDDEDRPGLLLLLDDGKQIAELTALRKQALLGGWLPVAIAAAIAALLLQYGLRRHSRQGQRLVLAQLQAINNGDPLEALPPTADALQRDIVAELTRLSQGLEERALERAQLLTAHQDLLHGVAHEFRSPMARLSFAIDMLPDTEDAAEQLQLRSDIDDALSEMEHLVKEVLQYNRLQSGGRALQYEAVDLPALAQKLLARQKPLTPNISFTVDGAPGSVNADAHLLDRALTNLLRNAARFAQQRVTLYWRVDGECLLLGVADDGIGVPPGKRDSIFEPFTRLDASRSRDSGGVGLGLSIVKSICDRHAATITVAASELGGADFVLRFPLRQG